MPVINDENFQSKYERATGIAQAKEDSPELRESSFFETVRSQVLLDNTIVNALWVNPDLPDEIVDVENFNPLDYLSEEQRKDRLLVESVALADSTLEVWATLDHIEWEKEQRYIRDNGSMTGVLAGALLNPEDLLVPVGVTYKTYKSGASILKAGMITGSITAGVTAGQEAVLHENQFTRTYGESAANVTAAGLLGGVLGMAPGVVKSVFSRSGNNPEKAFREIEETMNPEPIVARGENPSINRSLSAAAQMD